MSNHYISTPSFQCPSHLRHKFPRRPRLSVLDRCQRPAPKSTTTEGQLEEALIEKLRSLKYEYRPDITDRAKLKQNFREKFEALSRERQDRGGGGTDDDLHFPFHIDFTVFCCFSCRAFALRVWTVSGELMGFYGVLPYGRNNGYWNFLVPREMFQRGGCFKPAACSRNTDIKIKVTWALGKLGPA